MLLFSRKLLRRVASLGIGELGGTYIVARLGDIGKVGDRHLEGWRRVWNVGWGRMGIGMDGEENAG